MSSMVVQSGSSNENVSENTSSSVDTSNSSKKVRRRQKKLKGSAEASAAAVLLPPKAPLLPKAPSVPPLQKLYVTCKEAFANTGPGIVPTAENVQKLRLVLDEMKPVDFGLRPEMSYFLPLLLTKRKVPPVTYLRIHECNMFEIAIFCLPPSAVIPLHNHPGMSVFSKLLFGDLHIKSYDWVAGVSSGQSASKCPSNGKPRPEAQLAKLKLNSGFTAPCSPTILYPAAEGNIHCLTAKTGCCVLDVLGPPYCDADGRDCEYFKEFPFESFSVDGITVPEEETKDHAWLSESSESSNLIMGRYRGPKIMRTRG